MILWKYSVSGLYLDRSKKVREEDSFLAYNKASRMHITCKGEACLEWDRITSWFLMSSFLDELPNTQLYHILDSWKKKNSLEY